MNRAFAGAIMFALSSFCASCGLQGDLERPAPLWGAERTRWLEQQRQAEAAAKDDKKAERPRVDIPVGSQPNGAGQNVMTLPAESGVASTSTAEPESRGATPPVGAYETTAPNPTAAAN